MQRYVLTQQGEELLKYVNIAKVARKANASTSFFSVYKRLGHLSKKSINIFKQSIADWREGVHYESITIAKRPNGMGRRPLNVEK
jgi:hypothetical protein